jgi:hypothetical protein
MEASKAHSERLKEDLSDMEKKLGLYVDKGRLTGASASIEEPVVTIKPDSSQIKPLKKVERFDGQFLAVDCSTRTLKRANNWGVYLMRASYASIKERNVDWSYQERLCTALGDAYTRSNYLTDVRIELESQLALQLLQGKASSFYYEGSNPRSNYLLLDGGGYFGGERKFRVSLYERCEKSGISLLAICKNSPSLHDEKGRDLIATTSILSPYHTWVFHPVREADKDKSLYGDISLVKLCEESPRVFRCDIMEYLTNREVCEVLAPLTTVTEDPRCLGYPVPLWLAHEFSAPSDSMLLSYYDQVESALAEAGLLDSLRREEFTCSFADELHGIKHAFEWEWWSGQV